jgi:predicted DNA binding CopG/RHH family protein
MKKKNRYRTAPEDISNAIKVSEIIEDFLPAPEKLVKKDDNVKITILLSKNSITFFKEKAKKIGVPYQTMIKTVLDKYSSHYRGDK